MLERIFRESERSEIFGGSNISISDRLIAKMPLKTNKLIYWIKILLRYSYWISDALFFFDTFYFVRNILMLLLIRVFISRSLMSLVKC